MWAILAPLSAEAKPLYVTVPRAYSTAESPVIEVSFSTSLPVELRVLKPESLSAFVATHQGLRRAYEEPPLMLNPAHFLVAGLNRVQHPGDGLRRLLKFETRSKLSAAMASLLGRESTEPVADTSLRLEPGPEKLIGLPPRMSLVKSEWLNLDLGGSARDFSVPGYEYVDDSGYQDRRVTLMPLPEGIYVVQLVQGRIEAQVTLVVTNLVAQVKQSSLGALVRVADRKGSPQRDVQVTVHGGARVLGQLSTDANGEARLQEAVDSRLVVVVQKGNDATLIDTEHLSSLAQSESVMIHTDRPLYRPGERVRFRGVIRKPTGFWQTVLGFGARDVKVQLQGGTAEQSVPVDEYGCFSGELLVPKDADNLVRVIASLPGERLGDKAEPAHQAEVRVMEYEKPTYFATIKSSSDAVIPGQALDVTVEAKRYSGTVPKHVRYEYFLYRTKLDSPQWVDDAGLGGTGSAVTYGSVSTTEGKLQVPERLVSSMELREAFSDDHWQSAPALKDDGTATFSLQVPSLQPGDERHNYKYLVEVRLREGVDAGGEEVRSRKTFVLAACDVAPVAKFSSAAFTPGQPIAVQVRSLGPTGAILKQRAGKLVVRLERVDGSSTVVLDQQVVTNDNGLVEVPVAGEGPGRLWAELTMSDDHRREASTAASALLLGRSVQAVQAVPTLTAFALKDTVEPEATATVVAMFPEHWSPRDGGHVWVTLASNDVYESSHMVLQGHTLRFDFTAERRYGSSIYAQIAYVGPDGRFEERQVPLRIVALERILQVSLEPKAAESAPGDEQSIVVHVRDQQGRGVAAAVALSVVDKAVYAIAPEFRPRIVDFFYPLPRLDVSTFQSADFQGYGHGEMLARLQRAKRFSFADIKSMSNVVEAKEDDTIFWQPRLLTDNNGFAEARFKTPKRAAMFVATAVVADKQGRFGEQRAELATRQRNHVLLAAPSFLRVGDNASARVLLAGSGEGLNTKTAGSLSLTTEGAIAEGGAEVVVPAGSVEPSYPVALSARQEGSASVVVNTALFGSRFSERKQIDVLPAETVRIEQRTAALSEKVSLSSPSRGPVEVELLPGATAIMLSHARELLQYPYGCLEQLVATTIPNIVLAELLSQASRLDDADKRLLAKARSAAESGLAAVLRLQRPSGGFTWFDGYDTPSLPMTLLALEGLAYANDAHLIAEGQLAPTLDWVRSQTNLTPTEDALRAYVLVRHLAKLGQPQLEAVAARQDLTSVGLAYIALARASLGLPAADAAMASALTRALDERTQVRPASARVIEPRLPISELAATAMLWRAHLAISAGTADKTGEGFETLLKDALSRSPSTLTTSLLLLHALPTIKQLQAAKSKASGQSNAGMAPAVSFEVAGGKAPNTQSLTLRPSATGFVATLPAGTSQLVVSGDSVWQKAVVRVRAPVAVSSMSGGQPPDKMVAGKMELRKRYYALDADGHQTPISEQRKLHAGEEVFVELTLDTSEPLSSLYHVVSDPVPAGFSVVREDKVYEGNRYQLPLRHESLRKRVIFRDHIEWFFESKAPWSRQPQRIGYVIRADYSGAYQIPSASWVDMYDSSRASFSANARLEVE